MIRVQGFQRVRKGFYWGKSLLDAFSEPQILPFCARILARILVAGKDVC